jgi:signal transduction histidine kinase
MAEIHLASCADLGSVRKTAVVKFKDSFAAQPKWRITVEAVLLTLLIGYFDYVTSWEVSLFVFYAVPIFFASWHAGRATGITIALLAGVTWFTTNFPSQPYSTFQLFIWATINRACYFAFVAVGATAMRKLKEETIARVEALTLARTLELEVIRAGEREQIRIGQDLHDGVCQNLAAIEFATTCLRKKLETEHLSQADRLSQLGIARQIQESLKETIVEARNLARGIFPVQVETDGLASGLNELMLKLDFSRESTMSFDSSGDVEVQDPTVAVHLYRIAQEAVSNALRHSGATQIDVRLDREGSSVRLAIRDNGCGFLPRADSSEGIGRRTMRYRAQLIRAQFTIRSEPGRGTTIDCLCPVKQSESRIMEAVQS